MSGLDRRLAGSGQVGPEKLTPSLRLGRYCLETFMQEPLAWEVGTTTLPGGTDTNRAGVFTGRYTFVYTFVGGASDQFAPTLASEGGYEWKFDADAAAEGVTINFGARIPGHPRTFNPQTESWFSRILINTEDASGLQAFFGFTDTGAIPAGLTDYTNEVGILVSGTTASTTAALLIASNIGNTGSTEAVTNDSLVTYEEGTYLELEVRVTGRVATFYINGIKRASGTLNVTLPTTCTSLTTIFRAVQGTDLTTSIKTLAFECGLLADRSPETLAQLAGATT